MGIFVDVVVSFRASSAELFVSFNENEQNIIIQLLNVSFIRYFIAPYAINHETRLRQRL